MKLNLKNPPGIKKRNKVHRTYGIKKWVKYRLPNALRNGKVSTKKYTELIEAFCEKEKYFNNQKLKNLSELEKKELFVSNRFTKFCAFALKYEFKEEENLVASSKTETELVPV